MKLMDRLRAAIRLRHFSRRTEEAYTGWVRRYIAFHRMAHAEALGETEIRDFLSSLAVQGKVAASTQNQAMAALLFLYREVLPDGGIGASGEGYRLWSMGDTGP
jgi:hypothetical protein